LELFRGHIADSGKAHVLKIRQMYPELHRHTDPGFETVAAGPIPATRPVSGPAGGLPLATGARQDTLLFENPFSTTDTSDLRPDIPRDFEPRIPK
jgi:hypothetical protein